MNTGSSQNTKEGDARRWRNALSLGVELNLEKRPHSQDIRGLIGVPVTRRSTR